jgi:Phage tail tube protein
MALPSGLGAQWAAIDESDYGVAPSLSSAVFYACDKDSLQLKKVTKQGTGIFAGSLAPRAARRRPTEYSVQGALPMDLPMRQLNPWLKRMFGSFSQSGITLTEDGSTGAYSATHYLGDLTGHTFTLQAGKPTTDGTVEPFTYTGCKVQAWEISCAMGDIAKLNLTIEGRNELAGSWDDTLNGSVPSLESFTAPVSGEPFCWVDAGVYYGGTPSTSSGVTTVSGATHAGNVKGPLSLKVTRPMDTSRYSPDVAPFRNEPLQNGLTKIEGSWVVEWLSAETYLGAYQSDTGVTIELRFTGPVIGSGSDHAELSLLCSQVKLDGASPQVPGPDLLMQTIPWTTLDDGADNILQAVYWTLDSSG